MTEASHAAARALDDLYRRHGPEIYRYSLAVLGNHADAEDVTQTTFLNAYRALEQGVHPRKPVNWLLTIASNAIKQRFRQEQSRPHVVELDRDVASKGADDEAPSVGELLTALSKIPPQQRQAIVLREFEGRSYNEIAEILDVTTSALETLLFRARRSLAEELTHQLTCTEAQQAVSRATDGRVGRKEKRRLAEHVTECPDCAQFARLQQGQRKALRGLALVPIPLSLTLFKGLEGSAAAATVPAAVGAGAAATGGTGATAMGSGFGGAAAGGGGLFASGLAVKAAAVVAAAGIAGGVTVAGVKEINGSGKHAPGTSSTQGKSHEPHSQRAGSASANGLAHGKALARGQQGTTPGLARGRTKSQTHATKTRKTQTTHVQTQHPATGRKTRTRAGSTKSGASSTQPSKPQATQTQATQPKTTNTQTSNSNPTSNGRTSGDSQSSSSDTTQTAPATQTTESTPTAPSTTPTTTTSHGQSDAHSNTTGK